MFWLLLKVVLHAYLGLVCFSLDALILLCLCLDDLCVFTCVC